jgi:Ala-tRNA(Pro) deacylase
MDADERKEAAMTAKTIVLVGDHHYVRAVIPASERLDLRKVKPLIGCGRHTRFATEEEIAEAYPMFELGAVPPFGGPAGDVVVVDHELALLDDVIVEPGTHARSIRIATSDLICACDAQIACITKEEPCQSE